MANRSLYRISSFNILRCTYQKAQQESLKNEKASEKIKTLFKKY